MGSNIKILTDSQVVRGAVSKGRSSSFALLHLLKRLTASLLALDVTLSLQWIPTDINPADAASRGKG